MATEPFTMSYRRAIFQPAQLTFNFKQFRLTGYISPPSSSACHWSKEFQVMLGFASLSGGRFWTSLKSLFGIGHRKLVRCYSFLQCKRALHRFAHLVPFLISLTAPSALTLSFCHLALFSCDCVAVRVRKLQECPKTRFPAKGDKLRLRALPGPPLRPWRR